MTNQRALSQWYTRPYLAEAMVERAKVHNPRYVLEPSAGHGALILPMPAEWKVTAVELDEKTHAKSLENLDPPLHVLIYGDFLKHNNWIGCGRMPIAGVTTCRRFDVGIANPPFENDKDLAFALKLLTLCHVVLLLVRVPFLHRVACWEQLWSKKDELHRSWQRDHVSRPRFGGKYNPQDEYCIVEIQHGPGDGRVDLGWIRKP